MFYIIIVACVLLAGYASYRLTLRMHKHIERQVCDEVE